MNNLHWKGALVVSIGYSGYVYYNMVTNINNYKSLRELYEKNNINLGVCATLWMSLIYMNKNEIKEGIKEGIKTYYTNYLKNIISNKLL